MMIYIQKILICLAFMFLTLACGERFDLYRWEDMSVTNTNLQTQLPLTNNQVIERQNFAMRVRFFTQENFGSASSAFLVNTSSGIRSDALIASLVIKSPIDRIDTTFNYDTLTNGTIQRGDPIDTTIQSIDSILNSFFVAAYINRPEDTFSIRDFSITFGTADTVEQEFMLLMKSKPAVTRYEKQPDNTIIAIDSITFIFDIEINLHDNTRKFQETADSVRVE